MLRQVRYPKILPTNKQITPPVKRGYGSSGIGDLSHPATDWDGLIQEHGGIIDEVSDIKQLF